MPAPGSSVGFRRPVAGERHTSPMAASRNNFTPNGIGDPDPPLTSADKNVAGHGALTFIGVLSMRLSRDGSMYVLRTDGREVHGHLGRDAFAPTSTVATATYFPAMSCLHLLTTRGHAIIVELPTPNDSAPVGGRPVIYLDQNHWSTLAHAIHQPDRVPRAEERSAAVRLLELVAARVVILPMSAGHMSETCKQADFEQRYQRALTLAQLSAGWQLRDPLDLRRFELRQALGTRYRQLCLVPPAAITLEPNAVYASRHIAHPEMGRDLPPEAQWILHTLRCAGGTLDAMLDEEHVPMERVPGWGPQFERFAKFLAENPTGPEMKRRRTHAKFIADLGRELPEEAHRARIPPEQMSDWVLRHSETDLRNLPALGLYREVLHEKLCNPALRWEPNDLTDMMYLTAAASYCDYVVAERSHASHLDSGLRRLGRTHNIYRNLRELVVELPSTL